jgi:hypothetical protein
MSISFPPAYSNFLEWNSNAEVAEAAERLYSHIDNLELYAGLQAEEAKPLVDGAGLCPGMFTSPVHFEGSFSSLQDTLSVALFSAMPLP